MSLAVDSDAMRDGAGTSSGSAEISVPVDQNTQDKILTESRDSSSAQSSMKDSQNIHRWIKVGDAEFNLDRLESPTKMHYTENSSLKWTNKIGPNLFTALIKN